MDDLIFKKDVADTSRESYKELVETDKLSERHQEYIDVLSSLSEPSTDQEVTRAANHIDPNYFRPRRKELFDLGMVMRGQKRRCKITNKKVYTWYLRDMSCQM